MKIGRILVLTAASLCLAATGAVADGHHHFGYEGKEAPKFWGDLNPEWSVCKTGHNQSPIDIKDAVAVKEYRGINFHYTGEAKDVINNGHTIQANFKEGSWLELEGKRFELLQAHFHTPSEYTFDGKHFPMVAHIVHKAADGQMLVVGVMFQEGVRNTVVGKVFMEAPREKDKSKPVAKIDLKTLVADFNAYYRLSGSLTTPPCTEGVIWIIGKHPITASKEQMDKFTSIIGWNNRPMLKPNGRQIIIVE